MPPKKLQKEDKALREVREAGVCEVVEEFIPQIGEGNIEFDVESMADGLLAAFGGATTEAGIEKALEETVINDSLGMSKKVGKRVAQAAADAEESQNIMASLNGAKKELSELIAAVAVQVGTLKTAVVKLEQELTGAIGKVLAGQADIVAQLTTIAQAPPQAQLESRAVPKKATSKEISKDDDASEAPKKEYSAEPIPFPLSFLEPAVAKNIIIVSKKLAGKIIASNPTMKSNDVVKQVVTAINSSAAKMFNLSAWNQLSEKDMALILGTK